jgi:hypothetical protein
MTIEEKMKLKEDLEILPVEKLTKALEILSNYNSNVNGNEFEFEIDDLDIETLWELDWLVTNWKKSRNKKPRIVKYRSETILESTTNRLRSKLKMNIKNSKEGDEGVVVNKRLEKDLKNSKEEDGDEDVNILKSESENNTSGSSSSSGSSSNSGSSSSSGYTCSNSDCDSKSCSSKNNLSNNSS